MFKMMIGLIMIGGIQSTALADNTCENFAKSGAIKAYKKEMGTVQGSEGIQYEIKSKLKAKAPFHNYVVSITDNNEDGESWTVDYFVMTKFENNKCKVLKVNKQEESAGQDDGTATIQVTSLMDFENDSENLKTAKVFNVDVPFVNTYYVDFRLFTDTDSYPTVCYNGDIRAAGKIVEEILNVTTGDSYILTSKITFEGTTIKHTGTYTEGSGDYDMDLEFEVKKCD